MQFSELTQVMDSYGKPAFQQCQPVDIVSCEQQGKLYGQTTYYGIVIRTPNGDVKASIASRVGPIQPGMHTLLCQIKQDNRGKMYTFKVPTQGRPNNATGGGNVGGTQQGRSDDVQARISWNSAVNNAVNIVVGQDGYDINSVIKIAAEIYDVIIQGPPPQKGTQSKQQKELLLPVANAIREEYLVDIPDESIYDFAFTIFGKYPEEPLAPAAVKAAVLKLKQSGIETALQLNMPPF